MRLPRVLFWEFVQNLPLVTGFVMALSLWQRGQGGAAIACTATGSVTGSLVIRVTESKIVAGHREPLRVTVANVVTMAGLMLALVVYLSAAWSSWKTDLWAGACVGIVLGAVQDLAAREPIGVRHCVALASSFSPALIGTRVLVDNLPLLGNILILTAVVTLIIVVVDYGPVT